jgi:hypothetical protein
MSMIQTLKNNMLGGAGGQMASPQLNPQQQQMVEGLQKQKQQLQNQFQNASKGGSFFSGASQGIMSSPKNESFLGALARGIAGGNEGLEGHRLSQEKNLEKQSLIDQSIAQTYQFVDDYNYKRNKDREMMALQREKLDIAREGNYLKHEGQLRNVEAKVQEHKNKEIQENKKDAKPYVQEYNQASEVRREIENLEKEIAKLKPFNAYEGMLGNVNYRLLAQGTGNRADQIRIVDKGLNQLLTKSIGFFAKPGVRVTNFMAEAVMKGKPDLTMGTNAMNRILEGLKQEAEEKMARSKFIMSSAQQGYSPMDAQLFYDENPEEAQKMLGGGKSEPRSSSQMRSPARSKNVSNKPQEEKNVVAQNDIDLSDEATKRILNE